MLLVILLAFAAPADAPPFGTVPVLGADALATTTAREDLSQVAIAEQSATVSHSSVNGTSVTGPAAIDGNAFQGSSGLTIVNVNTGNNVAINSALNVNITFSPAP